MAGKGPKTKAGSPPIPKVKRVMAMVPARTVRRREAAANKFVEMTQARARLGVAPKVQGAAGSKERRNQLKNDRKLNNFLAPKVSAQSFMKRAA